MARRSLALAVVALAAALAASGAQYEGVVSSGRLRRLCEARGLLALPTSGQESSITMLDDQSGLLLATTPKAGAEFMSRLMVTSVGLLEEALSVIPVFVNRYRMTVWNKRPNNPSPPLCEACQPGGNSTTAVKMCVKLVMSPWTRVLSSYGHCMKMYSAVPTLSKVFKTSTGIEDWGEISFEQWVESLSMLAVASREPGFQPPDQEAWRIFRGHANQQFSECEADNEPGAVVENVHIDRLIRERDTIMWKVHNQTGLWLNFTGLNLEPRSHTADIEGESRTRTTAAAEAAAEAAAAAAAGAGVEVEAEAEAEAEAEVVEDTSVVRRRHLLRGTLRYEKPHYKEHLSGCGERGNRCGAQFAALPFSEAISPMLPSGDALWDGSATELAIKAGCTFIDDAEIYGYEPPPGVLPGIVAAIMEAGLW